jgi:O-methyltransferase domain
VGADPATFDRLLDPWRLLGMLERGQDARYQLTAMGALLRSDIAGSLRPAAVSYGQPWWWQPWGNLLDSVRTGLTAFDEVFHEPLFPFLARNPGAAAVFNANMTAMSAADAATLAKAFGLDEVTAVVDVGGGHGVLGRAILNRYPPISVVVFDRPDVVAGARTRRARPRWGSCAARPVTSSQTPLPQLTPTYSKTSSTTGPTSSAGPSWGPPAERLPRTPGC